MLICKVHEVISMAYPGQGWKIVLQIRAKIVRIKIRAKNVRSGI